MYGIEQSVKEAARSGKILSPIVSKTDKYKYWKSIESPTRCLRCKKMHGKIYLKDEKPKPSPVLHPNGKCVIEKLNTIKAGTATCEKNNGADRVLLEEGKLPDYYVTKDEARKDGWKKGDKPEKIIKGKMITGGEYENRNGHLPTKEGRIWYEADINYYNGKRNEQRIVWSNDGLIFVTYDHYETFYLIEED